MKRALILSMACVMVLSLAGCGHKHTWTEATCLTPKTCSECGQTEGEPLGHTWTEASCQHPKTCSVCGETEGEPLEHTWVEASYTAPKTCSVCGITEGEPLPEPYFEQNNITLSSLEDMSLPFAVAFTKGDQVVEPAGLSIEHGNANYSFGEITCKPSSQAGYLDVVIPYRVTMAITFVEDTSKYNGVFNWNMSFPGFEVGDYYTGLLVPERSLYTEDETSDTMTSTKEYEWNGTTYSISLTDHATSSDNSSGWQRKSGATYQMTSNLVHDMTYTVTIPEGFDGAVLRLERATTEVGFDGMTDKSVEDKNAYFLDEHDADYYYFFRLSDLVDGILN